jgi:hypothetical protein
MDVISLIGIIIAIAVIYFVIRFIVSPIVKAIVSVIALLILIYLLQRFFGFNLDQILAPFGISLNLNNWGQSFNWILEPINYYINIATSLFHSLWQNVPKGSNP